MTVFRWRLHKVTFWDYVCHILLHTHCLDWHAWSCQGSLVGNLVLSATVLRWWPLKKVGLSRRSLKEPLFRDWRSLTKWIWSSEREFLWHKATQCILPCLFLFSLLFLPCLDAYEITPMCLLDLNIQPIKLKLNKCFFSYKKFRFIYLGFCVLVFWLQVCLCTVCVWLVPIKVRKGHQISWNWRYG